MRWPSAPSGRPRAPRPHRVHEPQAFCFTGETPRTPQESGPCSPGPCRPPEHASVCVCECVNSAPLTLRVGGPTCKLFLGSVLSGSRESASIEPPPHPGHPTRPPPNRAELTPPHCRPTTALEWASWAPRGRQPVGQPILGDGLLPPELGNPQGPRAACGTVSGSGLTGGRAAASKPLKIFPAHKYSFCLKKRPPFFRRLPAAL